MKIKASSDGILKDILKEELSKKYTRYLKRQNALYYINGFESKNYYEVKKGDIIEIKFESKINKLSFLSIISFTKGNNTFNVFPVDISPDTIKFFLLSRIFSNISFFILPP